MARFPKIDQPCPLDAEAQKAIDGHCSRCSKTVHSLDGMSDAERSALMRKATGSVCVSYRMPFGVSAALALSMANPAFAADVQQTGTSTQSSVASQSQVSQATPDAAVSPASAQASTESTAEKLEYITVGGISRPGEAEWVDNDTSVPELPMVREDASVKK